MIVSVLYGREEFPLYVSQDGPVPSEEVAKVAISFADRGVSYLHHKEETVPERLTKKESLAYYRIANHYKFILKTMFDCFGFQRLILVEVSLLEYSAHCPRSLAPKFCRTCNDTGCLHYSDNLSSAYQHPRSSGW